jgi:Ca2+-binding RTX toxin-like protein
MATFDNIDTLAELQAAIAQANSNSEADTINITGNITLNDNDVATDDSLPLIEESVGLTINGGNYTISGDNQQRIFFVRSGNIVIDDLTLTQGRAKGGDSSGLSGGGAGMGGALFIYEGNVTVSDTRFLNNQAIGGSGNATSGSRAGGGIGLNIPGSNGIDGGFGGGNGIDGGFGGNGGNGGFGGGFSSGGNGGNGGFGGGGGNGGNGGSFGSVGFGSNGGNGGNGGFGGGGGFGSNGGLGTISSGNGGNGGNGGFGGSGGGAGMGGAVFVRSGSLDLLNVDFAGNTATGGSGSEAGQGLGGAIFAMISTTNPNGNNQGMPIILPTVTGLQVTFAGNTAADAANQTQDGNGVDLNTSAVFGSTTFAVQQVPVFAAATLNGIDGDLSVSEGSTVTLAATATDANAEPLTFTIDGVAAGSIAGSAGSTRTSQAIDRTFAQNGINLITFSVTDSSGQPVTLTRTLTVTNVAPTASLSSAIAPNGTTTISFSNAADASSVDTAAGFRYAYDLDNDGEFEVGDGTYANSVSTASVIVFNRSNTGAGANRVRGRILDQDGGFTDYIITIDRNPAPTGQMGTSTPDIRFVRQSKSIVANGTKRNDRLGGNRFNDRLGGKAGNDRLLGSGGNNWLDGGAGNDTLVGGRNRDLLRGGAGRDRLLGNGGDDILIGGAGNDTLIGGGGSDRFVFIALSEGVDAIQGFEVSQDTIDLRSILARPEFSAPSSFDKYQQYVQLVQVGANTEVRIDADGSGQGTNFVALARFENLAASLLGSTNFVI